MTNPKTNLTLALVLHLQSPTCLAQRPTAPGQLGETQLYITGATLRGALASRWLAGRRIENLSLPEVKLFRDVFLSGSVQFRNGWPLPDRPTERRTEIVPLTAMKRKRDKGWRLDGGGGALDILAPLLSLRRADTPELADRLAELDRLEMPFAQVEYASWSGLEPRRRLVSRTAINPIARPLPRTARDVADEGQLYNFVALEAGQSFQAALSGPADLLGSLAVHALGLPADEAAQTADIAAQIAQLLTETELFVALGQGRSRGLGQARLLPASATSVTPARTQARLIEQAREFSSRAALPEDEGYYLPITLESDVLLRDHYLLSSSSAAPTETLERYRPLMVQGNSFHMTLYESVQSARWIGGWDELRRLPRPPQLAVLLGSVWVFHIPSLAELRTAVTWWLEVEREGIGERLGEGFGRVRLLHPMHADERKGGW